MFYYLAKKYLHFRAFNVIGMFFRWKSPSWFSQNLGMKYFTHILWMKHFPSLFFFIFSHPLFWSVHGKWKCTFNCKVRLSRNLFFLLQNSKWPYYSLQILLKVQIKINKHILNELHYLLCKFLPITEVEFLLRAGLLVSKNKTMTSEVHFAKSLYWIINWI